MRGAVAFALASVASVCALLTARADEQDRQWESDRVGVVVEEVGKATAGERAGIEPEDILLRWHRCANPPANPDSAEGVLQSPWDWELVRVEQSPRGIVRVQGKRGGVPFDADIPMGVWKFEVRSVLSGETQGEYEDGKAAIRSGDLDRGTAFWSGIAERAEEAGDGSLACWINFRIAKAWISQGCWAEAERACQTALRQARGSQVTSAQAMILKSQAEAAVSQNELIRARQLYETALEVVQRASPDSLLLAGRLAELGNHLFKLGELREAEKLHQQALGIRMRLAPGSVELSYSHMSAGGISYGKDDLDNAERNFLAAIAILEKLAPEAVELARTISNLGAVAYKRGDFPLADRLWSRSLEIKEKLDPVSFDVALSLNTLGLLARDRGDLPRAEALLKRVVEMVGGLRPGSKELADYLVNLGTVIAEQGDLESAEQYHRRALWMYEELLPPDSVELTPTLINLGQTAIDRGDLATGEKLLRRALLLNEKQALETLDVAGILQCLGEIASRRGSRQMAEHYLKRSLAIRERLAPGSLHVALALRLLGIAAMEDGDVRAAEAYWKRSLAIREKLAPGSLAVAGVKSALGEVSIKKGDLRTAEAYEMQAMAIRQRLAPRSLDVAVSLHDLGLISYLHGHYVAAETYYNEALGIRERLAPRSAEHAESLHDLAMVYRSTRRPALAAEYFARAIDALESQIGRLGGTSDAPAAFTARHIDYYKDSIAQSIEIHREAEAFHTLERSRAAGFLAMLAQRDLVLADVPRELISEQKRLDADYERTQARIRELDPSGDSAKIESLLDHMRESNARREEVARRILEKCPRSASLHSPRPLTLSQVRTILDPGTLLLAYCLTGERAYLFAVTPQVRGSSEPGMPPHGLVVFTLPIDSETLRGQVGDFLAAISQAEKGIADEAALIGPGKTLYRELLRPAEPLIGSATRILLCPDGPLHLLPFSALPLASETAARVGLRPSPSRPWHYFAEWKPLHEVISATVYAELRGMRADQHEKPAAVDLVAFGDPLYPSRVTRTEKGGPDAEMEYSLTRGLDLRPLPATRREVERIAAVFPGRALTYLGEEASEEKAKTIGGDVRYLHYACHGMYDERFPLDSSLVLTIPDHPREGQDNGLLQAWEIIEKVRIDTDLVTLSACKSGMGKELGGEGLIGLTRAFQYAGARSVVASLWNVSDATSAELMGRFYEYLRAGSSKDEALRKAQVDMIQSRARFASHPYHWAAFQLVGDWI
ncbi:MAG: CHAT domain-containing protein [Acidobacteriota bacterium]